MSINGVYAAASRFELDDLLLVPGSLMELFRERRKLLLRESKELAGNREPSPPLSNEQTLMFVTGARFLDLDKYFDELHVLLTGQELPSDENGVVETDNPFSLAIAGGLPIEQTNTGYGPVRILNPEQIALIETAISRVTYDRLCEDHETEDCPQEYFDAFKNFFTESSHSKEFVLAAFI